MGGADRGGQAQDEAEESKTMTDHDRVMMLIKARCPELSDDDLALLAKPSLSAEMMDAVVDVVDVIEQQLVALEQGLTTERRITH